MESQIAKQLLKKYLNGTCSPEERIIFESWYNREVANRQDKPGIVDYIDVENNIFNRLPEPKAAKIVALKWVVSVAATIALLAVSLYFFQNADPAKQVSDSISTNANDVAPDINNAVLTLANGKKINLNEAKSGIVINASQLTYDDGTAINIISRIGNEIFSVSTPRGGQYNVELPDGTIVNLNAASTLKFPSSFSGLVKRTVELYGEGFFKVAKDKNHPFIVLAKDQEVKVLGTSFNLKAYSDEKEIKTTLVEGSIAVSTKKYQRTLKPGQRSIVSNGQITVYDVLPKNDIVWKDGILMLKEESIEEMMNVIARWYKVKIVYSDNMKNNRYKSAEFLAEVSNSVELEKVLQIIEQTGILSLKLEGTTVYVASGTNSSFGGFAP